MLSTGTDLGLSLPFLVFLDVDRLVLDLKEDYGAENLWMIWPLWFVQYWLIIFIQAYGYRWALSNLCWVFGSAPFSPEKGMSWGFEAAKMQTILQFVVIVVTSKLHTYWNRVDLPEILTCSVVAGALSKLSSASLKEMSKSMAVCFSVTILGLSFTNWVESIGYATVARAPAVICLSNHSLYDEDNPPPVVQYA